MTKDTKTALLDFAEYAARARGFDGFSYADMAEAIGIRKASIHYHFPTKADLSTALIKRYSKAMSETCSGIDAQNDTGAQKLNALVGHYRAALNDGETLCLCVAFTASRESLSQDVVATLGTFRAMVADWLAQVFLLGKADGTIAGIQEPMSEARATLALLEGAHLAARAAGDIGVFDAATALLRNRCR